MAVGLVFPVVVYGATVAMQSNHNDIKEWLPESFEETQEYNAFQREFSNDTYILASWDGCTLDDPRLAKFATLLAPSAMRERTGIEYASKVITGETLVEQLTSPPTNLGWKQAVGGSPARSSGPTAARLRAC